MKAHVRKRWQLELPTYWSCGVYAIPCHDGASPGKTDDIRSMPTRDA